MQIDETVHGCPNGYRRGLPGRQLGHPVSASQICTTPGQSTLVAAAGRAMIMQCSTFSPLTAAKATFALKAVCGSGAVVWSLLLLCGTHTGRFQAETSLTRCSDFLSQLPPTCSTPVSLSLSCLLRRRPYPASGGAARRQDQIWRLLHLGRFPACSAKPMLLNAKP
jgi:hypothetical protein